MHERQVRTWAGVGLAAQVLWAGGMIAAGFWQGRKYSVLSDSISDLEAVTAPGGLILVVIFTLCGLATILFAGLAVWPSLRSAGTLGGIGSAMIGLSTFGLGDLLTPFKRLACRIADEGCTAND